MMAASAVMTSVSGTVATVGNVQQARYRAAVADRNAALEQESARDALARGRTEEERSQRQTASTMGAQRAAMAANGIDLTFGSAASFVADTARVGQQDAATIRENATREARGMEREAANYRGEASAQRSAATGAAISGAFGVASSALGSAQQFKRMGRARNPYGVSAGGIY
ncbi:hypothetical protein [Sphingomonas qomolangmaensis]|uniref:Internal virion protein B n=1 Tax=Sphingomonas qomolangmaensis TaxID=2918765 RepID=A0ABY5LCC2_9SPHN|nr:hypothetical protein [Sphingomonas qomolangmaensis]UUL83449.1 hypothetical protein NMP03_04260 [Sphingomonas qomolangmaensis]